MGNEGMDGSWVQQGEITLYTVGVLRECGDCTEGLNSVLKKRHMPIMRDHVARNTGTPGRKAKETR